AQLAAVLGAGQGQLLAQHLQERVVHGGEDFPLLAVDPQPQPGPLHPAPDFERSFKSGVYPARRRGCLTPAGAPSFRPSPRPEVDMSWRTQACLTGWALAFAAPQAGVAQAAAVINEIHYAPAAAAAPELRFEYVEIYNNEPATVDLSGWALSNLSSGNALEVLFTFPDFALTGGCYAVVYSSAATGTLTPDLDCADDGRARLIAPDWTGTHLLANAGDAVYLHTESSQFLDLRDFVYYDEVNTGDSSVDDQAVAVGLWKDGEAIDTLSSGTTG